MQTLTLKEKEQAMLERARKELLRRIKIHIDKPMKKTNTKIQTKTKTKTKSQMPMPKKGMPMQPKKAKGC